MIALTSALPSPVMPAPPAAPVALGASDPAAFGQTLGAFLDAQAPQVAANALPGRQALADDGKDAPTRSNTDDADPSDTDAAAMPSSWFPAMPLPTTIPTPPTIDPTMSVGSGTTGNRAPPAPVATAADAVTSPVAQAVASDILATGMIAAPATGQPLPPATPDLTGSPAAAVAAAASLLPAKADIAAPQTVSREVSASPSPAATAMPSPISVNPTPQPAGQLFAAAIAAATSWRDHDARNGEDRADATAQVGFAAPVQAPDHIAVAATADAGGAALDLTHDAGLNRMIDHIAALRDTVGEGGAGARDTRIRLVPDALGSVDISVRQDGDRVHVAFVAEQPATRTLIADAQPRLTELAAERGVRIAGSSVSADAGGATPQQSRPAPQMFRTPAAVPAEPETPSDLRVA